MSHSPEASTPTLLSQRQGGDTLVLHLRLPELVWFAWPFLGLLCCLEWRNYIWRSAMPASGGPSTNSLVGSRC